MDDHLSTWCYVIDHIFFLPILPQKDDLDITEEYRLCHLVYQSALDYKNHLPTDQEKRWSRITRMLANLCTSQQSPTLSKEVIDQSIAQMLSGDVLAFLIRAQNAGIIMRKFSDETVFESFEVSPPAAVIMGAKGKLLCSYPGPAIAVPCETVDDPTFRHELASFLMQMNVNILDSAATTTKAKETVVEERDSAHPRYITQLLTGILRGMGKVAETTRIQKRIGDDVLWNDGKKPWRRSPLWLVIRVALQTSLYHESSGHNTYKAFMVFMMARTLQLGLSEDFPSDLLFCMRGKISRRLYKLGSAAPDFVLRKVYEAGQGTESLLQKRWSIVQNNQVTSARWAPDRLDIFADTHLSLPNGKSYLSQILRTSSSRNSSYAFQPKHPSRILGTRDFCAFESNNTLSKAFAADTFVALVDFESTVSNHLDKWVAENLRVESACATIASCITQYFDAALKLYASNPENLSIMILTVFELWVAVDKIAMAQCPLLREYSPEVPIELLEPLLLRRSELFGRLTSIQKYLRERHHCAHTDWSVFTDEVNEQSFAVRYFNTSAKHQSLRSRIEDDAKLERQNKITELQSQNDAHRSLVQQYESMSHEYRTHYRGYTYHHDYRCDRCSLERQADEMEISVHEWPLPQNLLQTKVTVFELACPLVFGVWRTTTYQVLRDICSPSPKDSADPLVQLQLEAYSGFQSYLATNQMLRITLASTTTSFLNTHYKAPKIPCDKSVVCLQNGLKFRLFDKLQDAWAASPFTECSIVRYCTPQLPEGPYRTLQYTVETTSHTSNQVLANQSECHQDLNLHEYNAFASLRSGHRLQWLNIARELRTRSLSFHREEVHALITQAAWQIGHLSPDGNREWHTELISVDFGFLLLQELEDLMLSVEANWLEVVSVRTITTLANRLLASTDDPDIMSKAYLLLRKARAVTFGWMHQLARKMQETDDDNKVQEFQRRVCEVAATCRGTYDVDPDHIPSLLGSPEDVAILVECAIRVYDNTPRSLAYCSLDFKKLLDRDKRLSHSLEQSLCRCISDYREGLDDAISAIWTGYRPGSDWKQLEPPNDRWLNVTTAAETGQKSQCVQLNLLDGQLLINGQPLGRLPQNITKHPTYARIFGQKVLDVIPSDIPDMDFATRSLISDCQVFFALRQDDTSLVIRARQSSKKQSSKILELVPHEKLVGDLPALLVENYTHWLDPSDGVIEFRPIEHMWTSSYKNWRIYFSDSGRSEMRQPSMLLVDIHSPTFGMISTYLKPLEDAQYLTVAYAADRSLLVDLPRFRLSFFLNEEKLLESNNMPGMVVDSDQSTGTMFGLSSQLVLRAKHPIAAELSRSRRVIIPFGQLRFERQGHHVSIFVDTQSQSQVKYHDYKIDTDLGCLVGTVSLLSKLYKIYLHAISSHCLPDPLTARTGAEEALHELRSASCQSFQKLAAAEADILHKIGTLTPARMFYPAHLEVMQSVGCSALTPMAQYYGFYMATQSILGYAKRLQVFHGQSEIGAINFGGSASAGTAHLLERAGRRAAVFYPEEFAGSLSLNNGDFVHSSRCLATAEGVQDEAFVFDISTMVCQWPLRLNTSHELFETFKRWGSLSGQNQGISLSYSGDWLRRDLAKTWISLYDLCRRSSKAKNRFQLAFSLSSMAYCSPENRNLIPTLLAFATVPQFRTLSPPLWTDYNLQQGFQPHKQELLDMVRSSDVSFQSSHESSLPARSGESEISLAQRRFSAFEVQLDSQVNKFVDSLIEQWPCSEPDLPMTPSDRRSWLFETPTLMTQVRTSFRSWNYNRQLRDHVGLVQTVLDETRGPHLTRTGISLYQFTPCSNKAPSPSSLIVFDQLFERVAPQTANRPPSSLDTPGMLKNARRQGTTSDLQTLISHFQDHSNPFYRLYGNELDKSRKNLGNNDIDICPDYIPYTIELLVEHRDQCRAYVEENFASIRGSLSSPSNPSEVMVYIAGLWPRVTTRSLLGKMASTSGTSLTDDWKILLISFAQGILLFQRSQRLLALALGKSYEEFFKELQNPWHDSQDAKQYPDWLLIQVDSNFLARPIQTRVAQEMIVPTSGQNTVLQLNMGEGKSSVIVPLVAAALADGRKLTRVIVLKPLAGQMFQLLVERLSGLANRRIFYMPFSRSVKLETGHTQVIQALYDDCMRVGGILVVQPEHILSFKLMCIERLFSSTSSGDREIVDAILESQRWLEAHSRDILDESDEILHVRYQLIYTMGQQQSLEDHPDRWTTIQQVLLLVKKHAPQLQNRFPLAVEVQESHRGSFPSLRILQTNAGKTLVALIANDIMDGALPNCSYVAFFPPRVRRAALAMITEAKVVDEDAEVLAEYCKGSASWQGLLLLRGLLAQGILVYALKERRWRVDYGLAPSRSLLAVPYRAKDVPAPRAEFGHPEVATTLTCLSYYYCGLSDDQLDLCFELLYKLDNPTMEYENWVHNDPAVPVCLHQLSGVNMRDPEQCGDHIFDIFRHNHVVINFYLSQVVFPKEAKEFPEKLTTSAWDIAESKRHKTTGFSGTNDNQHLLPTSIAQHDPLQQLSTNAKVITYLLRPENNQYICVQNQNEDFPSTKGFLKLLVQQTPEIRVLLDVGAQMLDMQNAELAKHWLHLKTDASAIIFFGDNDEMTVLTRDDTVEAFISSPFNQQLDQCLVYLDDAHTRGTDLKLPRDSRAAVTLGPKVTKDMLIQGCMRMRKLGHGQSVMFFAPPEVNRSILETKQSSSDPVEVLDLLRWTMLETCADIQHHVPHWAQQGVDHKGRNSAWLEFASSRSPSVERLKSTWLQSEAQTLEKMYGLPSTDDGDSSPAHNAAFNIPELGERCRMLGVTSFADTQMEEEQEREVDHEAERERQVERPPKAEAATHGVHKDVQEFVQTGLIPRDSSQIVSAFSSLKQSTTAPLEGVWSPNLFATKDFSTTIRSSYHSVSEYLQPVNWIISSSVQDRMVVVLLSPYEVNELLPEIRQSRNVHLHLYSPKVTQSMRSFDDLKFFCIPPLPSSWVPPTMHLMSQVNLWAGQLYISDYQTYLQLCKFLGLYTQVLWSREDICIQLDGFIKPEHRRNARMSDSPFTESPVPFLKELIGLRRKGMGYLLTHMGKILHARPLAENDF